LHPFNGKIIRSIENSTIPEEIFTKLQLFV
jgi:hypothetical protein